MNYINVINYGNKILKANKIKNFNLDSELILAKVLNYKREELLINLEKKIEIKKFKIFKKLVARRVEKEPIAYIFQHKEFWRYKFKVNQNVLIPRPETEIIVEEALKLISPFSSKHILDIGTGSGCIILSVIKDRPKSYGTAIDICKKAIKIAKINAKMHHLENKIKFINIDVDKFNSDKYDFILSNPPYISSIDYKRLDNSVRQFEPLKALNAGIDGLSEIKKLILKSKQLLKKNGKLVFEIGNTQMFKVKSLLNKNGFYINKICKDYRSFPRVIISTYID